MTEPTHCHEQIVLDLEAVARDRLDLDDDRDVDVLGYGPMTTADDCIAVELRVR